MLVHEPREDDDDDEEVSWRRWEQLGIYVWLNVCNQMSWVQYTSVPDASAVAFGVPLSAVTALATTYPAVYIPGSILAARAMRLGSLKGTLRESAGWMVLGSVLKVVGAALAFQRQSLGYAFTLVGQIGLGLGQPHLLNSPAALATDWFPVNERDLAATLGLLGNILGQAAGEALCPVVVDAARANDLSTTAAIFVLCLFAGAPCVVAWFGTFLRIENGPRRRIITGKKKDPSFSLLAAWYRALRDDGDFLILWLAFCLGISVFNSLLALAAQWLATCGYAATGVGFMTAVFVLVGIPAAAVVGAILDQTRAYRPVLKVLAVGAFLGTLALVLAARRNDAVLLYVAFGFLGGFLVAASAAIMDAAVELTYPKPPELSTGLLFCGGNVLSIAVTYILVALLNAQHDRCRPLDQSGPVTLFLIISFGLCAGLLLVYNGPYRRLQAEHQRNRLIIDSIDVVSS